MNPIAHAAIAHLNQKAMHALAA